MRFTTLDLPFFSLLLLPFVIVYYGNGYLGTVFWILLWTIVRQAIVMVHLKSRKDKRIILNTLPISHYVEKARWCLDKSGIQYEEEKDIGIFGVLTTGRMVPTLRVPGKNISISNSSDILRYLYGHLLGTDPDKAMFLKPTAESLEWESKFDKMGVDIRRYAYYHVLVNTKDVERTAQKVWSIHEPDVPAWQKLLLKVSWPIFRKFLIQILNVTPEGAADGLKKTDQVFEEVDNLLKDGRKYLLGTDEPTYIDYTFASLAAIGILPDQYGGPRLSPDTRPVPEDFGPEAQAVFKKYRKRPAGQFVLRMYKEHR